MRVGGVAIGVALAALCACSSTPDPTTTPDAHAPPNAPNLRSFGPAFAAVPPQGTLVRIDGAVLSRDRRTVSVAFVGGKTFDPANPCSTDYGAWAGIVNGSLNVQVHQIAHPEQGRLGPNVACTMEGYGYLFRIQLPEPYPGVDVVDRGSGPLWIAPPEAMAELVPIPDGWWLFSVRSDAATHEIVREYHPPLGAPGAPDRFIALSQTFGRQSDRTIDAPVAKGTIRGQEVPIGRNGDAGYLAAWKLGNDGVWLTVYDATINLDAFVAMANAVAILGA